MSIAVQTKVGILNVSEILIAQQIFKRYVECGEASLFKITAKEYYELTEDQQNIWWNFSMMLVTADQGRSKETYRYSGESLYSLFRAAAINYWPEKYTDTEKYQDIGFRLSAVWCCLADDINERGLYVVDDGCQKQNK